VVFDHGRYVQVQPDWTSMSEDDIDWTSRRGAISTNHESIPNGDRGVFETEPDVQSILRLCLILRELVGRGIESV
jgi:hypothetical protein